MFAGGSLQKNSIVGRIDERIDGGIGIYHEPTGLNLSAAFGRQEYTREFYESFNRTEGRSDGWITRVGIRRNWFRLGESLFATDFARINDALYSADRAKSVGAFFGQKIDELNMELYGGYRYYDYDAGPNSDGLRFHSIHAFTVGARMGFQAAFSPSFLK